MSVPPRSLTPAASAWRVPSGPSFTHDAWMFVIHGCSARRADRVDEQRLAEGRPAPRAALDVDRRLHRHERKRHELGEPARPALLLSRSKEVARPAPRACPTCPNISVTFERSPTPCAASCTASHCAVVTLSGQMTRRTSSSSTSAAVPGSEPRPRSRRWARYSLEREPERRGALPDLERRERVHVDLGHRVA